MTWRDFLGGRPGLVALRLAILSIIVGVVLTFFGVTPRNVFEMIDQFIRYVYDLGFGAVEWLLHYLIVGAIVVVPVWVLVRILRARPSDPNG